MRLNQYIRDRVGGSWFCDAPRSFKLTSKQIKITPARYLEFKEEWELAEAKKVSPAGEVDISREICSYNKELITAMIQAYREAHWASMVGSGDLKGIACPSTHFPASREEAAGMVAALEAMHALQCSGNVP